MSVGAAIDRRSDGRPRSQSLQDIPCPHDDCDWRFLQEQALDSHQRITHAGGVQW